MHDAFEPCWYLFRGSELLVADGDSGTTVPVASALHTLDLAALRAHTLEPVDGAQTLTAELPADAEAPSGMRFAGLRALHGQIPTASFRMAGRAVQILDWDRKHQYCGRCGTTLEDKADERAKRCPQCGLLFFPRLDPAVIVLIRRGDELLLARSPNFPANWYSTLAGFVEPGESLEEAVHREVMEEVGVTVTDLRYFGSQPWPFPHSLMVAFTAEYAGGELRFQPGEIADARWFSPDELPEVPPKLSIARQLIDWAVANRRSG